MDFRTVWQRSNTRAIFNLMSIKTELASVLALLLLGVGVGDVECAAGQAEGLSMVMCGPNESPYNA